MDSILGSLMWVLLDCHHDQKLCNTKNVKNIFLKHSVHVNQVLNASRLRRTVPNNFWILAPRASFLLAWNRIHIAPHLEQLTTTQLFGFLWLPLSWLSSSSCVSDAHKFGSKQEWQCYLSEAVLSCLWRIFQFYDSTTALSSQSVSHIRQITI